MRRMSFYTEQLTKKKQWKVVKGTAGPIFPGAESTVGRALELRILELDVASFLRDGMVRTNLSKDVMDLLQSNIQDENKHDEALNYAASVYQLSTPEDTANAKAIRDEWIAHPDHPIAKTAVLESSVFFVILPIFRFLASGCLKATSMDISNDENIHAATHRQLSVDLGLSISPSLNKLRRDTVEWMVSGLNATGKWGSKDVWLRSSDSLFERGIAPELAQSASYSMPAFFEIHNGNLQSYG